MLGPARPRLPDRNLKKGGKGKKNVDTGPASSLHYQAMHGPDRHTALWIAALVLIGFSWFSPRPADANPGFARRYGISCNMCHIGFPRLNDTGKAFAGNGYRFEGEDISKYAVNTGDPFLNLIPQIQFAVRVDTYLLWRNEGPVHSDFQAPFVAKLISYGLISQKISYYFYYLLTENGSVGGVEDAFIYFNNMIGDLDLDLMIGQNQVMDPIFSREQRLTYQDINIYTVALSKSNFNLTYDRGLTLTYNNEWGGATLAVLNGNGIGEGDRRDEFDNNSYKNQMGRVSVNLPPEMFSWIGSPPVTVGLFGYNGMSTDPATGIDDRFYRFGPDLAFSINDRYYFVGNLILGEDRNPDFNPLPRAVRLAGGFAELLYKYSDRWLAVLLYNRVSSSEKPEIESNLVTANLTHYLFRNFKLFVEYTHDLHPIEPSHPSKTHTAVIGIVLAF
jgi:hypothetical protein